MSSTKPRSLQAAVIAALGLSGAAALVYEVAWMRELSLVFSSTVYQMSATLAAFMAGLALGGMLGGRRADKPGVDPLRDLVLIELLIALFGVLSPFLIRVLPRLQFDLLKTVEPPAVVFFSLQVVASFAVMVVPTTLMGATLPVAARAIASDPARLGREVGWLYASNNVGAIVGSLAAGFVLVPSLGLRGTIVAAAATNAVAAAGVAFAARRGPGAVQTALVLALAGAGLLRVLAPEPPLEASFGLVSRYSSYREFQEGFVDQHDVVWSEENEYSRVRVLQHRRTGARSLMNGSLIEGSNGGRDPLTTQLLANLPAAYASRLDEVLVIGLGTGLTTAAALNLQARRVTTVEINPAVERASRHFGLLSPDEPRSRVLIRDARAFLQTTSERFDLITSEPSWPLSTAVAPLFTREFFQAARARLAPGGVFCQWLPQYLLPRREFLMMYKTFASVFPGARAWFVVMDQQYMGDVLLVGTASGQYPEDDAVQGAVVESLRRAGSEDLDIAQWRTTAQLEELVSSDSVPVNTDDRSLLEYRVPWSLVSLAHWKR